MLPTLKGPFVAYYASYPPKFACQSVLVADLGVVTTRITVPAVIGIGVLNVVICAGCGGWKNSNVIIFVPDGDSRLILPKSIGFPFPGRLVSHEFNAKYSKKNVFPAVTVYVKTT